MEKSCLRCGEPFEDPRPTPDYPEKNTEIACVNWCPKCNAEVMSYVMRGSSAYKNPRDMRGK